MFDDKTIDAKKMMILMLMTANDNKNVDDKHFDYDFVDCDMLMMMN